MLSQAFEELSPKRQLAMLLEEKARRVNGRRIEAYYPDTGPLRRELYPKHMAFLAAGLKERVRAAIAANRTGKTEGIGGYELTLHLTGDYPAFWVGKRFATPVRAWAAGSTNLTTRDILQAKLLGPKEAYGTGLIPRDALDMRSVRMKSGVPEAVDSLRVKHKSGGWSRLVFKSFEQGRKAFEGTEQEVILLDEEPDLGIYSECLLRTMTTGGVVLLTFTPLQGLTKLIKFLRESNVFEVGITWDDVPHLAAEEKAEILKNTPPHLRDARSKGVPLMGSGAVFPVAEADITVEPLVRIPDHWVQIGGLDFGWDHPSAAVKLAYDRDADVIHVTRTTRLRHTTPIVFAATVRPWGALNPPKNNDQWLPWAWPHDGLQHDKGSGEELAKQYRDQGLKLLPTHAQWAEGGFGLEAGILDMLDRMQTGRWKVWSTCTDWLEEFRNYHREDGIIVKEMDDAISASRVGLMMLRHAVTRPMAQAGARLTFVGDSKTGY
jgi:phage terminase large subunit-like protein